MRAGRCVACVVCMYVNGVRFVRILVRAWCACAAYVRVCRYGARVFVSVCFCDDNSLLFPGTSLSLEVCVIDESLNIIWFMIRRAVKQVPKFIFGCCDRIFLFLAVVPFIVEPTI